MKKLLALCLLCLVHTNCAYESKQVTVYINVYYYTVLEQHVEN